MYAAERHFVTTAKAQLRLLVCIDDTSNLIAHDEIKVCIHKIKLAANPVKARAVYRAALLCEDVLKRSPVTSTKFQTSLLSLKSLVGLYTDGLLEIDPDFKSALLDGGITANIKAPENSDESQDALITANESAAKTLAPLLKLVHDSDTAEALGVLASYGKKNSNNTMLPTVRFEAMMRQVTNRTLSTARAQARDISISYAADFDAIEQGAAIALQTLLENTCLDIVKNGLPKISGAKGFGTNSFDKEKRTWQISLTGSKKNQMLAISLTWPGSPLAANGSQPLQALQTLGGQIKTKTNKQADRDRINGRDTGIDIQTLDITCPATLKSPSPEKVAKELPKLNRAPQVGEA